MPWKPTGTPENPTDPVYTSLVNTESLSHGHTIAVETTAELIDAFANLSDGDRIYVYQPDTPFEISQWLDIDGVSNVKIEAESWEAADGTTLIKVADGADVGGIRIGNSASVTNFQLQNLAIDGNHPNQDQSVNYLHGIKILDAHQGLVDQCYVEKTSPYHQHRNGGSGVSVGHLATDITVKDSVTDDVGDRGFQAAGDGITFQNCLGRNGYDRSVSLNAEADDGTNYVAENSSVLFCRAYDNSNGSAFGVGGVAARGTRRNIQFIGNRAWGEHRRLVNVRTGRIEGLAIVGNVGDGTDALFGGIGGRDFSGGIITCNTIVNYPDNGINVENFEGFIGINWIQNVGGHGIYSELGHGKITTNYVLDAAKDGIRISNTGLRQSITNNWILRPNVSKGGFAGIHCDGPDMRFADNEVLDAPGNAFNETTNATSCVWIDNYASGFGTAWSLNAPRRAEGNTPEPVFDASPGNQEVGSQFLASATWDPDGDGNGERVEWDGVSWNEVADMPNL